MNDYIMTVGTTNICCKIILQYQAVKLSLVLAVISISGLFLILSIAFEISYIVIAEDNRTIKSTMWIVRKLKIQSYHKMCKGISPC